MSTVLRQRSSTILFILLEEMGTGLIEILSIF